MRIGIDLGGTKTEAIVLSDTGEELLRRRVPTPRGSYRPIVDNILSLVRDVEAEIGGTGTVGIGIPGAVSRKTGFIKNANTTELIGQPLQQDLSEGLDRPVRLANDANCFALSEATDGAGKGAPVVFGVIIGTGVGGGIVVNGQVLEGLNSICGEWGHTPLPWPNNNERPGLECHCGKQGCNETFLSGSGLSRSHDPISASGPRAEEIVEKAEKGDAAALRTLTTYERRLAKALTVVINILDPDVVVLGGGLSNIARLYENVPPLIQEYAFSDVISTPLVKAVHGDSSGVRGAAWLWPQSA